jgi:hypothetical protein
VNSTMIFLIYCKIICKHHNLPLPSTTIKKKNGILLCGSWILIFFHVLLNVQKVNGLVKNIQRNQETQLQVVVIAGRIHQLMRSLKYVKSLMWAQAVFEIWGKNTKFWSLSHNPACYSVFKGSPDNTLIGVLRKNLGPRTQRKGELIVLKF